MDLMAIDLGTSSVKITITDSETGEILSRGKQGYDLLTPHHGWVETAPSVWWSSTVQAVRECLSEYPKTASDIKVIGLSGQMHGIVPVDAKGNELYNCIMYNDLRADSILPRFPDAVREALERGGCNPLTSMMSAPKLLWLKHHEPEVWKRTHKWLMPKDYIRNRLAGGFETDISDASGTSMMDYATVDWMPEVEKVGLPLEIFPAIRRSEEIVGRIAAGAAEATGLKTGTPVVCGAADMACTALGTGAIEAGVASLTIGSAGHVIIPMREVNRANIGKYYQMCHAVPNLYYAFGPILSGGISLAWFRDIVKEVSENTTFSQLDELAHGAEPGCSGAFFLPYLAGTVIPHSDARARGAFVGLTLKNNAGEMVRAIMEGVAYAFKDVMRVMTGNGVPASRCNIGEGGSRSRLWSSIVAAAVNVPNSFVMRNKDSAPIGATILAGMGGGAYSDWRAAIDRLTATVALPVDPALAEFYDRHHAIYTGLYPALRELTHRIGAANGVK